MEFSKVTGLPHSLLNGQFWLHQDKDGRLALISENTVILTKDDVTPYLTTYNQKGEPDFKDWLLFLERLVPVVPGGLEGITAPAGGAEKPGSSDAFVLTEKRLHANPQSQGLVNPERGMPSHPVNPGTPTSGHVIIMDREDPSKDVFVNLEHGQSAEAAILEETSKRGLDPSAAIPASEWKKLRHKGEA